MASQLSEEVINQILRLLYEGRLLRGEIAKQVGVSRTSVNRIALGEQGKKLKLPPRPRKEKVQHEYIPPTIFRTRTFTRCPECGGMVLMPCMSCAQERTARIKRATRLARREP